jgi:hypothetical protein
MGEFDLDAAKAARAEKVEDKFFTFGGERFDLPSEMPYDVVVAAQSADGELDGIMRGLLGDDEAYARFVALKPSAGDVNDLVGWLMPEYGLGTPATNGASGEPDPKLPPS